MKLSRKRLPLYLGVGFVGALALAYGALRWVGRAAFPEPLTDPGRYGSVLAELRRGGYPYVAHFPASVPPGAADVEFYYTPGVLQGAMQLRLRYRLPATELRAVTAWADAQPTTRPRLIEDAPVHMVVSARSRKFILGFDTDVAGNHGHSHGVAIDGKAEEVVYWAEEW